MIRHGIIHWNLATLGNTCCVIALCKNSVTVAVLICTLPDNDKITIGIRRHCRRFLIIDGRRVHQKFAAGRIPDRVVTLPEDSPAIAVLTIILPDDNKTAIQQGSH